jgi:thioredoxin-dependent peroxiredoxin
MNRLLLAGLASAVVALPVAAALNKGDAAPAFKAQASLAGKEFSYSLADGLKKGPVVVYFYPSAYTQGCNIQAHTFAENMEKFTAAKSTVIGVASDADGSIAKSYQLKVNEGRAGMKDSRGKDIDHGFTERTTFIVTPDGKVAATIGGIAPDENVNQALKAVQDLAHAGH